MGYVGPKIKSLGQFLINPRVCSRDQIFGQILMKLVQSVCLDESIKIGQSSFESDNHETCSEPFPRWNLG